MDDSIRNDFLFIQNEVQMGRVDYNTWIRGKNNLAEVLTKLESFSTDVRQLTLFTDRLQNDFKDQSVTKGAEKKHG